MRQQIVHMYRNNHFNSALCGVKVSPRKDNATTVMRHVNCYDCIGIAQDLKKQEDQAAEDNE